MKRLLAATLAVLLAAGNALAAFPQVDATATSQHDSSTNPQVVSLPTCAAGKLLLAIITVRKNSALTTPNSFVTIPTGWTEIISQVGAQSVDDVVTRVSAKISTGGEGSSMSVASANRAGSHQVYCISAHNVVISGTATGIEGASTAGVHATDIDPPSLTPSWGSADTLWIAVGAMDRSGVSAPTAPTNFTDVVHITNPTSSTNRTTTSSARRENATTTEDPGAFVYSAASDWVSMTLAIQPAAASSGVPAGILRRGRAQ